MTAKPKLWMTLVLLLVPLVTAAPPELELGKSEYRIDQTVTIHTSNAKNLSLTISSDTTVYRYLGGLSNNLSFRPSEPGNYTVRLETADRVVEQETFTVTPPRTIKPGWLRMRNAVGATAKPSVSVTRSDTGHPTTGEFQEGKYDVHVDVQRNVDDITFHGLEVRNNSVDLRYEDVSPDRPGPKRWLQAYALDPTNLGFTNATVRATATGTELWTCKSYNYTRRTCTGAWTKLKDITPGETYNFTLTPEDPIFAESTHDADDCYEPFDGTFCSDAEVDAINSSGGTDKEFNKQTEPLDISFENESELIEDVQQCTFYVRGFDDDGNTWTVQYGNWSTLTYGGPTFSKTAPVTTDTLSYNCTSHFDSTSPDNALYDDFSVEISTDDGARPASAAIDYAYTIINFSVQDTEAPAWDNISQSPSSPVTYETDRTYQFNTTWTDNEQVDTVLFEHNFTGTFQNFTATGNDSAVNFYNYTGIAAGTYQWRSNANDTSGNQNSSTFTTLEVNKAASNVTLLLNGSSSNFTVNNNGTVNITGTFETGSGNISLYKNGTFLEEGPAPVTNITRFDTYGYQPVTANFTGNENYTGSNETLYVYVNDTIPPATVSDLNESKTGTSWILWNWTNPSDDDFNHSELYLDGNFLTNTTQDYYNVTSLSSDTNYTLTVLTADDQGNVNDTEVNDTAKTDTTTDTTPPALSNISADNVEDSSASITWKTDEDADSGVRYGTSPGTYTESVTDGTLVKNHSILLTGLEPNTTYYYRVNSTDAAGNTNTSQEYNFTTKIDSTPPVYDNITAAPQSPATYNATRTYQFNTTWTDNGEVDTVLFEHNFTGTFRNDTATGNDGSVYFYNDSGLAAGNYSWRSIANDTQNNENRTPLQTYTIDKASASVNLTLNGTDGNITVNESTIVNATGYLLRGTGNASLYRDGTLLTNETSPVQANLSIDAPGNVTVNFTYSGNQNFTSTYETHTIFVNDTVTPNVTAISPANDTTDTDGDLSFTYNVSDTSDIDRCALIFDGQENQTDDTITKDTDQGFSLNGVDDGEYTWRVNCTDPAGNTGASETRNITVNITRFTPNIVPFQCSDPQGDCTAGNVNESDGNYEEHGRFDKNQDYNDVYFNMTNTSIPPGSTILSANVTHVKYQDTNEGFLSIQWLNESSGNWLEACSQTFTQSSTTAPDTVKCNFTESGNGLPNRSEFNDELQMRSRFRYTGTANSINYGTDFFGATVTYEEDTTDPLVTLESPADGAFKPVGQVTFEYTPSDANLDYCTFYRDNNSVFQATQNDTNPDNDQTNNFTADLGQGTYRWNVECTDVANNSAFADANFTVNITNPDLFVNRSFINFSVNESDASEGETINVSSLVTNQGNVNATTSFTVEFYEGDPDTGGTQIDTGQTIDRLNVGENRSVNVSWTVPGPGPRNVFVRADTPFSTNGTVNETREDNNEANTTFDVPSYQVNYGNLSGRWTLGNNETDTLINFTLTRNTTGNIVVTESDRDVDFTQVQALTRNTTNDTATTDFQEADGALNMTDHQDNLTVTWTDSGTPKDTRTFRVFGEPVENVPVINSTNTSSFQTGILWDTSDGNSQYNGTQDLAFITKINQETQGQYGVYDYEVKFPRPLATLNSDSEDQVTFYYELR